LDEEDGKEDEILNEFVDEFDKKNTQSISKEFEIFLDATKNNQSQVIRYCQAGNYPLWSGKKYRLRNSDVPK
jgi:hypothetical protein